MAKTKKDKTIDKIITDHTTTVSNDYILKDIMTLKKEIKKLREDLNITANNTQWAIDKIEKIEPRFIQAAERLGL